MLPEVATSPQALERATRGELAALNALACTRMERVYLLAVALCKSDRAARPGDVGGGAEARSEVGGHAPHDGSPASAHAPSPVSLVERAYRSWPLISALCTAVAVLPREYRAPLVLIEMEGLRIDQAAWLLCVDDAVISSRLLAARTSLRDRLTGRCRSQPPPIALGCAARA
jgi:DNA-directed RNA polymerase specialized sigma24 family protein